MSVVTVSKAFDSPDLLHNCLSFLRDYAAEKAALAACAVVPLKGVAYPQVLHHLLLTITLKAFSKLHSVQKAASLHSMHRAYPRAQGISPSPEVVHSTRGRPVSVHA